MPQVIRGIKSASVALNVREQSIGNLHELVAYLAGISGCDNCGRIAYLKVDYLLDPPSELMKLGALSFDTHGG
jgi:hypothetical protein